MKIGIIGGSGLDNPNILQNPGDLMVYTRWGSPASPLRTGNIEGVPVILLARHGRDHCMPPSQVNYRAHIAALKETGCTHILATTAVGSLREEIARGDLVVLDQFIDFTKQRNMSFFDVPCAQGPTHTSMADPFNPLLRATLLEALNTLGYKYHPKGTVITIEGPRFSTRAESHMFRAWGADVINMSIATEAALANEAGIPYAGIAMSTDYDCWKEGEEDVTWEAIKEVFHANSEKMEKLLIATVSLLASTKREG